MLAARGDANWCGVGDGVLDLLSQIAVVAATAAAARFRGVRHAAACCAASMAACAGAPSFSSRLAAARTAEAARLLGVRLTTSAMREDKVLSKATGKETEFEVCDGTSGTRIGIVALDEKPLAILPGASSAAAAARVS